MGQALSHSKALVKLSDWSYRRSMATENVAETSDPHSIAADTFTNASCTHPFASQKLAYGSESHLVAIDQLRAPPLHQVHPPDRVQEPAVAGSERTDGLGGTLSEATPKGGAEFGGAPTRREHRASDGGRSSSPSCALAHSLTRSRLRSSAACRSAMA